MFYQLKIYLFQFDVGRVRILIRFFLFEQQAFNGLLKVIVIQRVFFRICLDKQTFSHNFAHFIKQKN